MRAALSFRKWKNRPFLVASAILAVALMLFFAAPRSRVAGSPMPHITPPSSLSVMIASRPLPAGTVIAPADLRARAIAGALPTGAFSSQDEVLGRIALKSLAPGETLLRSSLRDLQEVGIAARVPAGQRAYAIRVAEDEIVGGFLQSGDYVDVFATIPGSVFAARDAQNLPDRSQAVLLLQNVLVLAVGENPATRGSIHAEARTVSLSLPPKDLARLTLALRFGKVSLAIRTTGDAALSDGASATLADLVRLPTPAAPTPASTTRHVAGIPFYTGTRTTLAQWNRAP
jgi:pilus assembly protein CpaB